jgi:glycogen phosphorylase
MAPHVRPASLDDVAELADGIVHLARYYLGRRLEDCSPYDLFRTLALAVRAPLIDRLLETERRYQEADAKQVYYLSAEFLIGQSLRNNLLNIGMMDVTRRAASTLGVQLDAALDAEPDAALGNGGLGRLAACFLDSLATLDVPGFGYGINYQFGLFRQVVQNGAQREQPDNWKAEENPWLIPRSDETVVVPVYGSIAHGKDRQGHYNPMWLDWKVLIGVPADMPIVGYGGRTVNVLRLYSARASDEFDMQIFNHGDYIRAVEQKIQTETISKVLYPSDSVASGKELRLVQEYFMVACALRDIVRRFRARHRSLEAFPDKVAIQLNDTHPALAIAELMRLLVDEEALEWERAWEITQASCAYTNHTLLPEALEKWPVSLIQRVLPRHLQIIYEINRRFLDTVKGRWPRDSARLARMSLIEEGGEQQVRMAHLAIVGSHSVNGVAALHTELVKTTLVPDFHELWPERFNNKTNGVTHRRWLMHANPGLSGLLRDRLGEGWIGDPLRLRDFSHWSADPDTQAAFRRVKRANKERLARVIRQATREIVDLDSMFDVQVKRIHEYKRQLLNVMHVVHLYLRAMEDGVPPDVPRTVLFAGKAAPGYVMAKLIIRLINEVAAVVNGEPRLHGLLKVVFVPDYRVSLAELIVPAADLSEQISTAGTEASGTGNMKLAMNGALTIGTMDGATIEIREEVGEDNIYIFGLRAPEVQALRDGGYSPWDYYHRSATIRRIVDAIGGNLFCASRPGLFRPIHEALLYGGDRYLHLADIESYIAAQERVSVDFADPERWARKGICNVAGVGRFSSDRTVREYASEIWGVRPVSGRREA